MTTIRRPVRAIVIAVLLLCFRSTYLHAAEFWELAARIPPGANAVVVVNAAKMFASPLAQREAWQVKFADAFEATPFILPPSAQRAVIGARLNRRSLHTEWQAAALELSVDPDLAEVAKNRGGELKQLTAGAAALLPGEIWVTKFAPHIFGLLTPANDDMANRWLAQSAAPAPDNLSPYLRESLSYADTAGTEVILALDLKGTLQESDIRKAVAASTVLKGISAEQATKILASIQGVKFGVRVTDVMNGRLQLDFAENAAALGPVAKPLILAIVGRVGAMLEEFPRWTAEVEGNHIAITGVLTNDGMQRIFSLLELDAAVVQSPEPYDPPPTQKEAMAAATKRYFKAVSKYVEGSQRLSRADSVQQAIMWLENFARRIQNLPAKNVDPEVIEYGKYVAQTFQSVTDLAYGVEQKLENLAAQEEAVTNYRIGLLPTANTVNYGGYRMREYAPYGYAQIDAEAAQAANQLRQRTEDEVYQANQQAVDTLTRLAADHETVRKNLTERYGEKF
jgi:hypothetical protein